MRLNRRSGTLLLLDSKGSLIPMIVEVCGSILDDLLHVLAEVTHPSGFGVQADGRPRTGRSMSQSDCGVISGRNQLNW